MLRAEHVTVLWLTAQLTNFVVDTDPDLLRPLRVLVTGGEALSPPHMRRLRQAVPGLTVVNGYGPTETTTFAATYQLPRQLSPGSVPIGHPIGGTRTLVLDADLNLVPVGVTGELYIGGQGTARGYLGRPGLTAVRFVPDPAGRPGERLYRTGDLARWLSSGALEFAGRTDDQVKLRGFRIEPGEVAATLKGHPEVRDAFVAPRGQGLGAELVAYVVTERELGAQLRAYAGERLPGPMVPAHFVSVGELPLTANGKVDRAALPEPDPERGSRGRVMPATSLEASVAGEWAGVLGVRDVRADDNFFLLGGNSLTATRAVSRLAARSGIALPLSSIFLHPTVAELAAEMTRLGAAGARDGGEGPRRPAAADPRAAAAVVPRSAPARRSGVQRRVRDAAARPARPRCPAQRHVRGRGQAPGASFPLPAR